MVDAICQELGLPLLNNSRQKRIYSLDINNSFGKNEIDCNLSKYVSWFSIQDSLEGMSLIHLNPSTIIVTQDVHVG